MDKHRFIWIMGASISLRKLRHAEGARLSQQSLNTTCGAELYLVVIDPIGPCYQRTVVVTGILRTIS